MSTHACIYIHLKEEDRNKTFKTPWGDIITPNGKAFMGIYCHIEGYLTATGKQLVDLNMPYNEALEYILAGDRINVFDAGTYWEAHGQKFPPECFSYPELMGDYGYILDFDHTTGENKVLFMEEQEDDSWVSVKLDSLYFAHL